MRASVQTTLVYLLISHLLLFTTSPGYKHELKRAFVAAGSVLHRYSFGYIGVQQDVSWRLRPRSGLYSSTELLHSMQQHMHFDASQGVYTANDLVAYMSATDVIKGQGWPARATLFMQLMAPRYTLLPVRNSVLEPNMQLFSLAAADLPAVGRLGLAEDPRVGFRVSCSSPAMQYSLGPQPAATCKVWPPAATAKQPAHSPVPAAAVTVNSSSSAGTADLAPSGKQMSGVAAPVQDTDRQPGIQGHSRAVSAGDIRCSTCPAAWGLYTVLQGSTGSCCARRVSMHQRPMHSSSSSSRSKRPIATWTVLPTGVGVPTKIVEGEVTLLNDPITSAAPAPGSLLALLQVFDEWLIFPRTPLLRLLPAMSGMQQLLYGYAVLMYTWADLLYLITTMQRLHLRSTAALLAGHRWSILTAACSVTVQLIALVLARLVITTTLSITALIVLHQLLRFVRFAAVGMALPTLKWMGLLLWIRGRFGWGWSVTAGAAAAAAAGAAVGAVTGGGAVRTAAWSGLMTLISSVLRGAATVWPVRWFFRQTTNGAAVGAAGGQSPAAVAAAQIAAGSMDSTTAAAGVARQLLQPHYAQLLTMHNFSEDLVLLTGAVLVGEVADIAFDFLWKVLVLWGVEVQVLIEASAAAAAMLLQGASWQAAFGRLRQVQQMQLEQRRAEAVAGDGRHNRVQAQVFLQAPGDIGQAAEALRNLADELEDLAHQPLGFMAAFGGLGNLLHPNSNRRRARVQMLGEHWPVPLEIPFDLEEIQDELNVEVPRGFVCPITQDVMRLPALLISSSVAVPATYDKDAITRWLDQSRLDPKSRQPLAADAQLVPNMDLYRAIEDWVAEKQADRTKLRRLSEGAGPRSHAAHDAEAQQPSSSAGQPGSSTVLALAKEAVAAVAGGVGLQGRQQGTAEAVVAGGSDNLSESDDPDFSAGQLSESEQSRDDESDFITSEEYSNGEEGLLSDEDAVGPSVGLQQDHSAGVAPAAEHGHQQRSSNLRSSPGVLGVGARGQLRPERTTGFQQLVGGRYHLRRRSPSSGPPG